MDRHLTTMQWSSASNPMKVKTPRQLRSWRTAPVTLPRISSKLEQIIKGGL